MKFIYLNCRVKWIFNVWSLQLWPLLLCMYYPWRDVQVYPECVIASWDALILLLGAENIEWRVQLNAEKKIKCVSKLQTPGKNSITRYANSCFVIGWLALHGPFRCKFSDKSQESHCVFLSLSSVPRLLS